jgi:HK97 family phage portal protein
MSPFNFKEACMTSLNLGGNTVCQRIENTKTGELVALIPIPHSKVNIKRNNDGVLVYTVADSQNKKYDLSRSQVFHIPNMSYDGVIGLSPITYASGAIKLGMTYESYGNNFYKNGAHSSGTIEVPLGLSETAYNRLKEQFKKNFQGLHNAGNPVLLEEGAKFNPISIKPADAQLIENKRFQVEDICRIYRVPLHLVQDLSRSTNNNIEHQSLEFVMYTMLPYFKRWEENVNAQLLTKEERKAGYYLEINAAGLLRGDMASRSQSYAVARQWGWMSVNDIRKLENMPPITNGDIYLTPLNMHEAGTVPPKSQSQAMAEEIYKMIQEGRVG